MEMNQNFWGRSGISCRSFVRLHKHISQKLVNALEIQLWSCHRQEQFEVEFGMNWFLPANHKLIKRSEKELSSEVFSLLNEFAIVFVCNDDLFVVSSGSFVWFDFRFFACLHFTAGCNNAKFNYGNKQNGIESFEERARNEDEQPREKT